MHRKNLAVHVDLTALSLSPTLSLSSLFREDEYLHRYTLAAHSYLHTYTRSLTVNASANVLKQNNGLLVYIPSLFLYTNFTNMLLRCHALFFF